MSDAIEVQLLRWSEGPAGRTVTFLLPDDTPQHPFKGLRAGPSNGQRLALAVALIADDETKHDMPSQAPEKPVSGQNGERADKHRLSRQAALCCQDARFRLFIEEHFGTDVVNGDGPDFDVPATVRYICGVKSRSEFDTDTDAAACWRDLHGRYIAWREAA